jgi:hypothetical protein
MRTTITRSPKNNSSIRRSDLSTAGVDEGVPTIGLVVPGSETDRMFGRVGSARLSLSSGTSTEWVGTLTAGRAAKLRYCGERLVGLVSVADRRVVARKPASSLWTTKVPSRRRHGRLSPRSAAVWSKAAALTTIWGAGSRTPTSTSGRQPAVDGCSRWQAMSHRPSAKRSLRSTPQTGFMLPWRNSSALSCPQLRSVTMSRALLHSRVRLMHGSLS